MQDLVEKLSVMLKDRGMTMATAESCTGGMIAAAMTDRPGSSAVFERGFVTYSNNSKTEMLGVPADLIETHGAISREVAQAMAKGALDRSRADVAVSVTGIAGPDGGTPDKPVGLVYIGYGDKKSIDVREHRFSGDRISVRKQATETTLCCLAYFLRGGV